MITLQPILILIVIFGGIIGIVYLGLRKKERMAMLERGVDASAFSSQNKSDLSLKYGLLLVGVALGVLSGNVLSDMPSFIDVPEAAYFSMIFLFGGSALVIYHFLAKKQAKGRDMK